MRRTAIAVIFVGVVSVLALWSTQRTGRPGEFTVEDIARKAKELKSQMKAELAAEGKRYEPGAFPSGWGYNQRAYPYDRINFDQLKDAVIEAQAMRLEARRSQAALSGSWVEEGPSNIGARVADIEVHPTDPDVIYAAQASSGVFKTTDGGSTWQPITDDLPVLTFGDIALDPRFPDTIYVGTGEANAHSFSWFGMGMYKSTDGGATWNYIGLEDTRYIGRVVVDPLTTSRIWVAGTGALFGTNPERGVYRSLDARLGLVQQLAHAAPGQIVLGVRVGIDSLQALQVFLDEQQTSAGCGVVAIDHQALPEGCLERRIDADDLLPEEIEVPVIHGRIVRGDGQPPSVFSGPNASAHGR